MLIAYRSCVRQLLALRSGKIMLDADRPWPGMPVLCAYAALLYHLTSLI